MRISEIIKEFLDYRAYVSHTLCKHRLFLGLSSPANARLRLRDAAVWPLVRDEAAKLCTHAATLFGIVSKPLDGVRVKLLAASDEMTLQQKQLDAGKDEAFEEFRKDAEHFSDALSEIYEVLDEGTPDFAEEPVLSFLDGRKTEDCLVQAQTSVRVRVAPLLEGMLYGTADVGEFYRRFWGVSSEAYFLTRCAIVAAAADELSPAGLVRIRELQKILRGAETVASCWAPIVAPEHRPAELEKRLRAESLVSGEALLARLRAQGVAS